MNFGNTIAIIDDGVNELFLDAGKLKCSIEITEDLKIKTYKNDTTYNHSTTCIEIINEFAPTASIVSIRIQNDNRKNFKDQLAKALEWCILNRIRLVNVSACSKSYMDYETIRDAVNRAFNAGIIIVAACHNRDIISYPSALENVIGVKADRNNTLRDNSFFYHLCPVDGIDVTAVCDLSFIPGDISDFCPANSFAAPRITAFIYNQLRENPSLSFYEIKQLLQRQAVNTPEPYPANIVRKIDWLHRGLFLSIGQHIINEPVSLPDSVTERVYLTETPGNDKMLSILWETFADTVILYINEDLTLQKDDELRLIHTILNHQKNLIYLNDRSNVTDLDIQHFPGKLWAPFYPLDLTGTDEETINEKPILLIRDFTKSVGIEYIQNLVDHFKNKEHHTVGLSNVSLSVLYGFEYIPHVKNPEESAAFIRSLLHAYEYDLSVIFIREDLPNSITESLKCDLQPDIIFDLKKDTDNACYFETTDKKRFPAKDTGSLYTYVTESIKK